MKYLQFIEKKVIERNAGTPYLIRRTLIGFGEDSKWFSIKVHKILISDDMCLHDHPWWFVSIILKGSYTEWRFAAEGDYIHKAVFNGKYHYDKKTGNFTIGNVYKAGTILIRPANWAHRLELEKPVYTLVFTFKKIRKWGFFTPRGWKVWYQYVKQKHC